MGAYVQLLEYNNIEGMILLSELSRRRIRSINKLIRVGRNEVAMVIRVDKDKGYIDLSKRRVSPAESAKCEDRFNKAKGVHAIVKHVSNKLKVSERRGGGGELGGCGEGGAGSAGWGLLWRRPLTRFHPPAISCPPQSGIYLPLYRCPWLRCTRASRGRCTRSGRTRTTRSRCAAASSGGWNGNPPVRVSATVAHVRPPFLTPPHLPSDALQAAVSDPDAVFRGLDITDAERAVVVEYITARMAPQPLKIRADVQVTCFGYEGIEAIRAALVSGAVGWEARVSVCGVSSRAQMCTQL
jgi:predicted RNA-binding protein with RPS1 domain